MNDNEFYYRKESISKKRLKKFASRKKENRVCSSHGIVGAHVVNSEGNLPSDIDFVYLRSREDYQKMKEYNKTNEDKLHICTGCSYQEDSEYFPKKSKRDKFNAKCFKDSYLPSKSKKEKLKGDKDENCPICLDSMKGRLIKKFGCSHSTCLACFDKFSEFKTEEKQITFDIGGVTFAINMTVINQADFSTKYHNIFNENKKKINYTVKCPMCRSSIFNNNDETIVC
jgi:hypothetical protein